MSYNTRSKTKEAKDRNPSTASTPSNSEGSESIRLVKIKTTKI